MPNAPFGRKHPSNKSTEEIRIQEPASNKNLQPEISFICPLMQEPNNPEFEKGSFNKHLFQY